MPDEKPDTLVTAGEWFRRAEDCFGKEHYIEAVRCYRLAADQGSVPGRFRATIVRI